MQQLQRAIQLCRLTTFRIGGTPAWYLEPRTPAELLAAIVECRGADQPWRVLGGGSNVLVEEGDLGYAVIHIHTPGFDWIARPRPDAVRVGAGVPTYKLLAYCRRRGLGGLEFLAGIPGVIGGAVAGNAGAWGTDVAARLTRLWLLEPDGTPTAVPASEVEFSYRHAGLDGRVITQCEFRLEPRSPDLISAQMEQHRRDRAERHPLGEPSAGCTFKNPPAQSAGKLIDACGLKGLRVGDAEVSTRHANFIVNRGRATAGDVLRLIDLVKQEVRRQFDVDLELEIQYWPARASAA